VGTLRPVHTGLRTAALGFVNHGETLTVAGMLFVNKCGWAHVLAEAAWLLDRPRQELLTPAELAALDGRASPEGGNPVMTAQSEPREGRPRKRCPGYRS
jgi:hypothetical protein